MRGRKAFRPCELSPHRSLAPSVPSIGLHGYGLLAILMVLLVRSSWLMPSALQKLS